MDTTERRAALACALAAAACLAGCEGTPKPPKDPLYTVELATEPRDIVAGQEAEVTLRVLDARTGDPVTDIDVTHERVLHTFIVADDLSFFQHIHHEDFEELTKDDLAAGTFHFPVTFPTAGGYHAFVQGSTGCLYPIDARFPLEIEPGEGASERDPDALTFDAVRTKSVGDLEVSMRIDPEPASASGTVSLTYDLFKQGGEPVDDLEMYLGAEVHVAAFREDLRTWSHGHPPSPGDVPGVHVMCPAPRDQIYEGPSVPVSGHFATPGRYKIFATFKRGGELMTVDFWLRVEP